MNLGLLEDITCENLWLTAKKHVDPNLDQIG